MSNWCLLVLIELLQSQSRTGFPALKKVWRPLSPFSFLVTRGYGPAVSLSSRSVPPSFHKLLRRPVDLHLGFVGIVKEEQKRDGKRAPLLLVGFKGKPFPKEAARKGAWAVGEAISWLNPRVQDTCLQIRCLLLASSYRQRVGTRNKCCCCRKEY